LVVVVLTAGCAGGPLRRRGSSEAAYGAYLRGLMLERQARLPDALHAYHLALEHDADSAYLQVRIGVAHVKLGETERARRAFERALALDPQQPDALRWLAMLHTADGRLDAAIEVYERLLAVEPNDEFILSTLADLYVLQGRLPQAIALYERLIREFGSTSQLHFNLGVLHGRLDRFGDAVAEFSRAYERSPESADVRVALGLTYELRGRFDRALPFYEEAIRLDPFEARLYHHAARAAFSAGRLAEAAANYQAVLDLAPRDLEAITGLIRVWISERRFRHAEEFLAEKLRQLNDPPQLYVLLGLVYREADEATEALRAFERAVALDADYAQGHFHLAAQLDQLGRKELARQALRRTLELDAHHADALNYLGYLDAEAGVNLEEARAFIERAVALEPDNGAYLDSLGWVHYQLGDLGAAVRYLEQAAELLETDPVIFDHLGETYYRRREWEKARRSWERALELDPARTEIVEKLKRLAPE
jgi:tetratricopeptide (TPR) repeat protein